MSSNRQGTGLVSAHLIHLEKQASDGLLKRINRSLEAAGLNNIFGHREEDAILLEPEVAEKLNQKLQRPDAIYGLRQSMYLVLINRFRPCS